MKDQRRSINGREISFVVVVIKLIPAMSNLNTKFSVVLVILKLWFLLESEVYILAEITYRQLEVFDQNINGK